MEKKEFQVKWFAVTGVGIAMTILGGRKVLSRESFKAVVSTSLGILKEWLLP